MFLLLSNLRKISTDRSIVIVINGEYYLKMNRWFQIDDFDQLIHVDAWF
jgi:hypothetical protein